MPFGVCFFQTACWFWRVANVFLSFFRRHWPGFLCCCSLWLAPRALQIWVEPELVSLSSQLYTDHPDWCLHVPSRGRTTGRNQLVLDFTRKEVRDNIYGQLEALFSSDAIS